MTYSELAPHFRRMVDAGALVAVSMNLKEDAEIDRLRAVERETGLRPGRIVGGDRRRISCENCAEPFADVWVFQKREGKVTRKAFCWDCYHLFQKREETTGETSD